MKKYIINIILLACLSLLFVGCEDANELVPTPNTDITSIRLFSPAGTQTDHNATADANGNIEIVLEGSVKMDLTQYSMSVNIANNSKVVSDIPLGSPMDFSKPVSFDIVASDGSSRTYTINVRILATNISVDEMWYKTAPDFEFTQHNNRSIALSGDYFVVHDRATKNGAYNYYKIADGSFVGKLPALDVEIDALHMISDDAGNIVNCSFTPKAGDVLKMFWWNGVKAEPKKLVEWTSTVAGNLGRKIYVKGDMTKLAYIYVTEANGSNVARWEVKNGEVTSPDPEVIHVSHPVPTGWGTNGRFIPIELGKNSNYFVNSSRNVRITYMDGVSNSYIYNSEDNIKNVFHQWLGGGQAFDYLDLQGARYLFVMEQNATNWMPSIYKVHNMMKDPNSIENITKLIHRRLWGDTTKYPNDAALGTNGNVVGEVKVRVAADGKSAIVAFLCTNTGVAMWNVSLE